MSSALRELRRLEQSSRERLAGHLLAMGNETARLAESSARNHTWGHVTAGGLVGLLLGAQCSSRGGVQGAIWPRWARIPPHLALGWILRFLIPDSGR